MLNFSALLKSTLNCIRPCHVLPPNATQKFLNLWRDVTVFVACYSHFWSWRRLGLALICALFALEFDELHRNAYSLGSFKPGYKPNLILPRGKVFPVDQILSLGLPSSCCSLGADFLMTICTRRLCTPKVIFTQIQLSQLFFLA